MLQLIRSTDKKENQNDAVYGKFIMGDDHVFSMERPWIPSEEFPAGKSSESCVPVGDYDIVKEYSPKYEQDMYYIINEDLGVFLRPEDRDHEWQRWGCMIHPANWVHQINGCIAPGLTQGMIGDKYGVGASVTAKNKVYKYIDSMDNPKLSITWD